MYYNYLTYFITCSIFSKTSNPKLTKFTVKKSNFNSRVLIDWSVAVTTIP